MQIFQLCIKEVSQNRYFISSATENIIMKVHQKILIYTFSATLAFIKISIIIFLSHLIYSVFSKTLDLQIFSEAFPLSIGNRMDINIFRSFVF